MTTIQPAAVRAYLDDLRNLLTGSPDRDLVVDGVARHIQDALADGAADPARVQAVLDELGDPAVIAAEAAPAPVQPAPRPPFLERRGGAILTVLLLSVGGIVVPVAGWIVGLGLLWFSKGWRLVDKVLGTAGPFVLAGLGALIPPLLSLPTASHLGLLIGLAAYVVLAPIYLLRRFRAA